MGGLAPGTLLSGRFELVRRLGAGGLAEVFLARDRLSGQEVALKALHAHLVEDAALSGRFRREMVVTRGLEHPGIVRVFDLHEDEGRPFISMELLRGRTLAEHLRDGPLPRDQALRIARQICEALRAAHRAGVVHRDLKPQNVFLTQDGAVKLLDFGLARVTGEARFTAQSAVMGTPGYISPELLAGAQADARADVYSLGVTLFEMLTGQHAFPGVDPYEVLRKQREGAPALPGPDAEVVRRALEPDPERRYLDADQLLRALGGEHVPVAPEPRPALSAGELDVIVSHEGSGEGKKLAAIVSRLGGGPLAKGWRARLAIDGKNRLAAGVNRATADMLVELCRDQGLAARSAPARKRRPVLEWLARHSTRIGVAVGVVPPLLLAVVLELVGGPNGESFWWTLLTQQGPSSRMSLRELLVILSCLFSVVFVPLAGLLGVAAAPPLKDLPRGDPALRRLVEGIARRVACLRERASTLPEVHQQLLSDLVAESTHIEAIAAALAQGAEPSAPVSTEAETLPQGSSRDGRASRLLDIAAALDDALAVADQPAPTVQSASGALSRLRGEIEFAQRALPAVSGEQPARAGTRVRSG